MCAKSSVVAHVHYIYTYIVCICSFWFELDVVWGGVAMSKLHDAVIVTGPRKCNRKTIVLRTRKIGDIENRPFVKLFTYHSLVAICGVPRSSVFTKSIASVKSEIKRLMIESRPVTEEIDLGIDDQRDLSKPRAKALADESICTIVFPARGNIPSRPIRVVRPRKKSKAIEVELSTDVIDYFVDLIHHEMLKHPKEIVMDSESTDRDGSSDEIVDDD